MLVLLAVIVVATDIGVHCRPDKASSFVVDPLMPKMDDFPLLSSHSSPSLSSSAECAEQSSFSQTRQFRAKMQSLIDTNSTEVIRMKFMLFKDAIDHKTPRFQRSFDLMCFKPSFSFNANEKRQYRLMNIESYHQVLFQPSRTLTMVSIW